MHMHITDQHVLNLTMMMTVSIVATRTTTATLATDNTTATLALGSREHDLCMDDNVHGMFTCITHWKNLVHTQKVPYLNLSQD